jgi:hypothetical protein
MHPGDEDEQELEEQLITYVPSRRRIEIELE